MSAFPRAASSADRIGSLIGGRKPRCARLLQPAADALLVLPVLVAEGALGVALFALDDAEIHDQHDRDRDAHDPAVVEEQAESDQQPGKGLVSPRLSI